MKKSWGKAAAKYMVLFLVGGLLYGGIEILWRGYTHPAMIVGGWHQRLAPLEAVHYRTGDCRRDRHHRSGAALRPLSQSLPEPEYLGLLRLAVQCAGADLPPLLGALVPFGGGRCGSRRLPAVLAFCGGKATLPICPELGRKIALQRRKPAPEPYLPVWERVFVKSDRKNIVI